MTTSCVDHLTTIFLLFFRARAAPLVDYYAELNNKTIPPPPSVVGLTSTNDIELVTAGETWENFRAQWVQAYA